MRNVDKYLQDVDLIKGLLREREDRVLLRPWAFFVWSLVVVAATLLSVYLWRDMGWTARRITWTVWTVALILGGSAETIAWVQFLRREEPAAFTAEHLKLLGSFCGVILAVCTVVFVLVGQGSDISGVLLPLFAICMFVLAIFTFKTLLLEAYGCLALGLLVVALGIPAPVAYQIAGYGTALVFAVAGFHTHVILTRRHG